MTRMVQIVRRARRRPVEGAIVDGRQPVGLTSSYLLHHPLPDDWEEQRASSQRCEAGHAVSQPAAATLTLGLHQSANGIAPY